MVPAAGQDKIAEASETRAGGARMSEEEVQMLAPPLRTYYVFTLNMYCG